MGFVGGASMILAYFLGAIIGGFIANLSFELINVELINILFCMLSKVLLVGVFVPIFLVMSVVGKQRTWLSMIGAFMVSMLLFTMIPMISPLNSTLINVLLSFVGAVLFSIGIGAISNIILKKTSLV